MTLFDALTLVGGIALFLYGMKIMGDGLTRAAGSKLENLLERLTSTTIKGVLLGAAVTGVIQSSGATTVMVVGFVNSGIMKLQQAVGIIMGANIGTTVTSWILSLAGIQGDSLGVRLLQPASWTPILAVIGIILVMFTKSEKKHDVGTIFLGFAVLMFGMNTMTASSAPLADMPGFSGFLLKFTNPLLGVVAGAVITAALQSSSASVGILQALCMAGSVPYSVVLPIIMGQNIGTCVTALLSSIGARKNAKRAAFIHLYFNLIGTIVFMTVVYIVNAIVHLPILDANANPAGIAVLHSTFNVVTTIAWLPFTKLLVKLATITVPGEDEDVLENKKYTVPLQALDERFLERPSFAVAQCENAAHSMADLTCQCLDASMAALLNKDEDKVHRTEAMESAIDMYEDQLGTYLVKLSNKSLSLEDSEACSEILYTIGNLERISDHALNIAQTAQDMMEKDIHFSDKAGKEVAVYSAAVREIVSIATKAFSTNDLSLAKQVEPLEEVIDNLNSKAKKHHIKRLQKGKCTIPLSVVIEDLYINFERVADHCSNIAVTMIQVHEDAFDTHEYVETLREEKDEKFRGMYEDFSKKYAL